MRFEVDYEIKDSELEQRYKHVHHASSLCFLELCRLRLMEHIGFPNEKLLSDGLFIVITNIDVTYKRELFAEKVKLVACEPNSEGKLISLRQQIEKENGKLAVDARIRMACMDGESKRAIAPPEDFLTAFTSLARNG